MAFLIVVGSVFLCLAIAAIVFAVWLKRIKMALTGPSLQETAKLYVKRLENKHIELY